MHPKIYACPKCRSQYDLGAQFCFACGASLPKKSDGATLFFKVACVIAGACVLFVVIATLLEKNPPRTASPAPVSLALPATLAPQPTATPSPFSQLVLVKSNWERGGFGAIAIWKVTFKNTSDRPIGDIQYRTTYYSETGNVVDRGGVDSLLDKKTIQKVVPPKSTRTFEVNDGFTHSEANRAAFELVDCRFVYDSR